MAESPEFDVTKDPVRIHFLDSIGMSRANSSFTVFIHPFINRTLFLRQSTSALPGYCSTWDQPMLKTRIEKKTARVWIVIVLLTQMNTLQMSECLLESTCCLVEARKSGKFVTCIFHFTY